MPNILYPDKSALQLLSLLMGSQARADSTYSVTEPVTVRPHRAIWDYCRYPICLNLKQALLMAEFTRVSLTYVGQPGTVALDGYMGFVIGQRYELGYRSNPDGSVVLRLKHPPYDKGVTLLYVTPAQYRKWWVA
jgi:hypothetical protein